MYIRTCTYAYTHPHTSTLTSVRATKANVSITEVARKYRTQQYVSVRASTGLVGARTWCKYMQATAREKLRAALSKVRGSAGNCLGGGGGGGWKW